MAFFVLFNGGLLLGLIALDPVCVLYYYLLSFCKTQDFYEIMEWNEYIFNYRQS